LFFFKTNYLKSKYKPRCYKKRQNKQLAKAEKEKKMNEHSALPVHLTPTKNMLYLVYN